MFARSRLLTWPGLATLAVLVAGCSALDQSTAPTESSDRPMLPNQPVYNFRMTGGGRIDDPEGRLLNRFTEPGACGGKSFATFGLNAGPGSDGDPTGNLEWVDHCRGLQIHGYDVTLFRVTSGTGGNRARGCAVWEGPALLNGQPGYRFRVDPACDEGEPGRLDWIAIELIADDGTVVYLRHGLLTGGNLQTHSLD